MSDNLLQTLQTLVQDVVAPDVRELKVKFDSLEKRMDARFASLESNVDANQKSLESRIDTNQKSLERQLEATAKMLLASVGELKAQNELATMSAVAELRERVAVLEAKRN